ncbi:MAG: P1 family peptidase, partial [Micromonosporaceae bacterium]
GVGSASVRLADGVTVAALAVVNAAGSPVDPTTGELYATRYGLPGEFPIRAPDPAELAAWPGPLGELPPGGPFNTVIGVLATDAALTKAQCSRLAGAGHDGLARAVRPAHSMTDGDTIFGFATVGRAAGGGSADGGGAGGSPLELAGLNAVLAAAADCFTRAVGHAMLAATGREGAASYAETFPSAVHL